MSPFDSEKRNLPLFGLTMAFVILIGMPLLLILSFVDESKISEALLIFGYAILTIILYGIVRSVGRSLKAGGPLPLPKKGRASPPMVAPAFDKIRDEVRISTVDRVYFHRVLKKRILKVLNRKLNGDSSEHISSGELDRVLGEGLSKILCEDENKGFPLRGVPLKEIAYLLHRIEEMS